MENNDRVVNVSVEEGDMVDGFVPTVEHVETVSIAHEEVEYDTPANVEAPVVPQYVPTEAVVKEEPVVVSKGPVIGDEHDNEIVNGILNYKFKKPVDFDGVVYEKAIFDFESLTGKDIKEAVRTLTVLEMTGLAETNKSFLANLAAKSAGLPIEFMDYVGAKDFSSITVDMQTFLFD